MSPTCFPDPRPALSPASEPKANLSPATPPAEPTQHPDGGETSFLSLTALLSSNNKQPEKRGRAFDAIKTESVLIDIETLLDAMEIIHGTFHNCGDLDETRKCLRALEPVLDMTVAETAKLRATLFGGEA